MMPELYLAPALGAVGKPMFRVHTAGSVGGSTAIVAAHLVASGVHERVLTVAFEKQSDSDAMWALSVPQPFSAPLLAGAGGYFAPIIRAYMHRSGAPRDIGMMVAVKDRLHALKNPYAHLHLPDISMQDGGGVDHAVGPAALPRVVPVLGRRRRDGHRVGEGRGCGHGVDGSAAGVDPRHGHALGTDDVRRAGTRSTRRPAATAPPTSTARPASPTRGRDFDMAEVYVPFSWYEPMWLENLGFCDEGDGWKLTAGGRDVDDRGRRHPVELLGWRALVQSDRRVGDAALPRDRTAGAWNGRRAPGAPTPAGRSGRHTAAARSSSPCGSSAPTGPEARGPAGMLGGAKPALTRRSP